MPKRSTKLQRLIAVINACIAPNVRVEESAMLLDQVTGELREVDVVLRASVGDYPVVVGIEVVDRGRPIGTGWVEEMTQKHHHLHTNKLILVSGSGFTEPALRKAAALGVEALTLDDAQATDWDLALGLTGQGVFELFQLRFNTSLHLEGVDDWVKPNPSARVHLPYRTQPTTIRGIVEFLLSEPRAKEILLSHVATTEQRQFHMILSYPGLRYESPNGRMTPMVKLSLELKVEFSATPVVFAAKRFRTHEVVSGEASAPDSHFCFALTRAPHGKVQGMLYDAAGFRLLVPETASADVSRPSE